MRNQTLRSVLLAVVFASVSFVAAGQQARRQMVWVSIPKLRTNPGERVVGFEFHVTSGRIATVPDVPIGWSVSVNNDPSWKTDIQGSIAVGAAAIEPSFFRRFLVIERDESLGVPFAVEGEIVVSEDFEHERHIRVTKADLVLTTHRLGSTKR